MSEAPSFFWKIMRAGEHVNTFLAEEAAFAEDQPCQVRIEQQEDNPQIGLVRVESVKTPGPRLAILVGDALQCLRSSLDHIVWQLSAGNSLTPQQERQISFPIVDTAAKFATASRSALKYVSPAARSVIEGVQPYHDARPEFATLFKLNELNNRDKHRALLLAVTSGEPQHLQFGGLSVQFGVMGGGPVAPGYHLEPGGTIAGIPLMSPYVAEDSSGEMHIAVEIALNEAPWGIVPAARFLAEIGEFITNRIVEPLATELRQD